jgi:hypothetical protein
LFHVGLFLLFEHLFLLLLGVTSACAIPRCVGLSWAWAATEERFLVIGVWVASWVTPTYGWEWVTIAKLGFATKLAVSCHIACISCAPCSLDSFERHGCNDSRLV